MRKKITIVNFRNALSSIALCILLLGTMPADRTYILAAEALDESNGVGLSSDTSPGTYHYEYLKKVSQQTTEKLIDLFGTLEYDASLLTPAPTQPGGVNPGGISGPPPTPFPAGSIRYFRQCNYRNVPMNSGLSCSMCNAGCGPTAVATIVNMFGYTDDPPAVLARYHRNKFYAGCGGTSMTEAKKIFDTEYRLKTTDYFIRDGGNGLRIDSVAQDIRSYVKAGWVVFALTNFCSGGCGHYIVITDIDENNNVTAYDPYYESNSPSQPISYSHRYPAPYYRYAFGVKRL